MPVAQRPYNRPADYQRVGQFLIRAHRTSGHINWLQPRWEYMHYHPLVRDIDLGSIGVWEADGRIVAVAHPEHEMGTVYFQIDPEFDDLKDQMMTCAEARLAVRRDDGTRRLRIFISDDDPGFQRLASQRGFTRTDGREEMSHFTIPSPFPPIPLPHGFRLKSLPDDNHLHKVHRVMWRGFNHDGDPPPEGIQWRRFMQSAPNFRPDLNIVVEAPDGQFIAYCGMWLERIHRLAYVEPVCTDPDYRREGLGRAAVLEGIRRCGQEGATAACVGTTMRFYLSMGFKKAYGSTIWEKHWG